MAAIHGLLKQIADPALRSRLEEEYARITQDKKFGLVFEEHIPECTPLYGVPVKRGSTVARKAEKKIAEVFSIITITDGVAVCLKTGTDETVSIPVEELVSVAKFGEAIFPTLQPVDAVENAPDSILWHTLIEADNYHALQLLEYLYPNKVECIYIDPPYNTGARDWKYNNDYVDSADGWRHSKRLSMMKKRLKIAKRLLSDIGVMIVAIDDYEYAHLAMLIEELFPEYDTNIIVVNHHPQGGSGDNIARTHEYALFVIPHGAKVVLGKEEEVTEEEWSLMRSGKDRRNHRYGRPNQFYALYVDTNTHEVKDVGPRLSAEDDFSTEITPEGWKPFYPISGKDGSQRVWRYERSTMLEKIKNGLIICTESFSFKVRVIKENATKNKAVFSNWTDSRYNAGPNGTDMLTQIFSGESDFPYPKSLYTVFDMVQAITQKKKDALIVDFFAGSGTTLNAVNLLNIQDGGTRRCIMVTNNEVAEKELPALTALGLKPGDEGWEKKGICRSVTWPRAKYTIYGKRDNGDVIDGEYTLDTLAPHSSKRKFVQLSFIAPDALNTIQKKKQVVALLGKDKLPQSLVKADTKYIVSEKHRASILFDDTASSEWLDALDEQEQVREFYVVTQNTKLFNGIKDEIQELLGDFVVQEQVKRPMSDGFPANVEYFKLGFLDKNSVSLGRQFKEILPLLWLKSGAVGKRPEVSEDEPDMLILPQNRFAVLLDENRYAAFIEQLPAESIDTIYFVTNSEDAFHDMSLGVKTINTYQLYRDYVDNFVIGSRRNSR